MSENLKYNKHMKTKQKPFYMEKPTKNEINFIKYLAYMYGVKLNLTATPFRGYLEEDGNMCKAYSVSFRSEIYICLKEIKTVQSLFIAFFHELQHCINYQEKKFYNFHKQPKNHNDLRKKISLTLRAELYTDRRAAELQNAYAPFVPYVSGYDNEEVKEIVRFENQITKLMMMVNGQIPFTKQKP